MAKIIVAAAFLLTSLMGIQAEEAIKEPTVDVTKPSFTNIILRKPQIFDNLPKDQDITIFAPSDEAFSKLKPEILNNIMKPENNEQLENLMHYHVTTGEFHAKDLKDGMTLKSAEGEDLKITNKGGKVMINDAVIIESDGITRKGVMHRIDKVLIPDSFTMEDLKD